MNPENRLLFVYNADSGLFNTMADIGHKIFSPETYSCALCALTHGYFTERREWREFIESLECDCRFLHRDEFVQAYPDLESDLPAVFRFVDDNPVLCATPEAIRKCRSLEALKLLITEHCRAA